jgi:hypothetical protein
MPSISHIQFLDQLRLVEQLIAVHSEVQQGRGRRHRQDAIHKAGVVMTVAAWQAYLEKIVMEVVGIFEEALVNPADENPAPDWSLVIIQSRKTAAKQSVGRFNTPNSHNTRTLLRDATGFDPQGVWEWHQGRRQWNGHITRERTDAWVKIRHTVAHGSDLPADFEFLHGENGEARLTLNLLKECVKHFEHLVRLTDEGLMQFLLNTQAAAPDW